MRGLHHLVYEVVDNSVDEALAGFCTEIEVSIESDGSVTVRDDGRGIPVDMHHDHEEARARGRHDHAARGQASSTTRPTRVSGGLHGVGVSVVNALSAWCEVEVLKDGKLYRQRYERGKPTGPMTSAAPTGAGRKRGSGTTTRF